MEKKAFLIAGFGFKGMLLIKRECLGIHSLFHPIIFSLILLFMFCGYLYAVDYNIDFSKLPLCDEERYSLNSKSSVIWDKFSVEDKEEAIETSIARFKEEQGIIIKKSAEYYVRCIDHLRDVNSESRGYPVGILFRTLAVMEYDFDEGVLREETAKKWLGDFYDDVFMTDQVRGYSWSEFSSSQKTEIINQYISENNLSFSAEDMIEVLDMFYAAQEGIYLPMALQEVLNRVITCDTTEDVAVGGPGMEKDKIE